MHASCAMPLDSSDAFFPAFSSIENRVSIIPIPHITCIYIKLILVDVDTVTPKANQYNDVTRLSRDSKLEL